MTGQPGNQRPRGESAPGSGESPRRYGLDEPFRRSQLGLAGTTVVRIAVPYGYGDRFRTPSPCCGRTSLISAVDASYHGSGSFVTCRGCQWKWAVHLALGETRLRDVPPDARHPHITADRAEWVSRGSGTRPYRRRRP